MFASARPGVGPARLLAGALHHRPVRRRGRTGAAGRRGQVARYGQDGSPVEAIGTERSPRRLDYTCGSLGQGLSAALGFALADRFRGSPTRGSSPWSATGNGRGAGLGGRPVRRPPSPRPADSAARRQPSQVDGPVDSITTIEPIAAKWSAFGWHAADLDGHDVDAVRGAHPGPPRPPRGSRACWSAGPRPCTAWTACRPTRTGTSSSCRPSWLWPRTPNSPASWRPSVGAEPSVPSTPPVPGPPVRVGRPVPISPILKPYGRALVDLARRRARGAVPQRRPDPAVRNRPVPVRIPGTVHSRRHGRGQHDEHGGRARALRPHPVRAHLQSVRHPATLRSDR